MSLLYWLPMLGSLENQGLSNAQPVNHGATVNTAGKLGSCYDFSGTQQYINTGYKEELGSGDFSIAAWFKLTDSGSRTYQPIISNKNTAAISVGCAIYYNHSQQKFLWSTADGSSATEIWMLNQYPYATMLNTWHHIVMVRNSSDVKKGYFYIDGVRYELNSVPAIRNVTNTTYNMMIGDICNHANSSYSWTGSICDLRIYDNAISAREAKELSKGLFLHYPLSREGFGCDNLLLPQIDDNRWYNWQQNDTWSSENTREKVTDSSGKTWAHIIQNSATGYGGYCCDPNGNHIIIDPSKKYTISALARAGTKENAYLIFWCHWRSTEGGANLSQSMTQCKLTNSPKRVYATWTPNAVSTSYVPNRINLMIGTLNYANNEIYFTDIKFEEGDNATPWIPHQEDPLYYDMGLNTGNANLLTKSAINPANWTHIYPTCTRYTGDGYDNLFTMVTTSSYEHVYLPVTVTANQQYTFSVTYQVLDSFELWQSSRPFSFQVLKAVPTNADTYNNVIGSILIGNTAMASPQRGSTTFTPTTTTIWLNIPGAYYKDGSTSYNKRVKFSRLKLETGGTATPWVSAESDQDRSGNVVYDVSGFGNNGTSNGITYSSDTPRYYTSTQFDGLDDVVLIQNFNISEILNTQCTISFWIKPSGETGARSIYFGAYGGVTWNIEKSAANRLRGWWNGTPDITYNITIVDDVWQHIAMVKNGTSEIKAYYNGELKQTVTSSHGNMVFSTTWRIGRDNRTNDGTPYKGLMSDFRIYATALTDEEILELYNSNALTNN